MKLPKILKGYDFHCNKKDFSCSKLYNWTSELARFDSCFPRIANRSLPSAPATKPVSQDSLRKWERAACDQTYMCNQAAAFSKCLTKVEENMDSQLKVIQGVTSKGKSSGKLHQAADELDYLITFNRSITQAMARTMQDLSDGVFISMAKLTLARSKQDRLASLRTTPLHMRVLFPDQIIAKAQDIQHHEDKRSSGPSDKTPQHFHPYSSLLDSNKTRTVSLAHQHGNKLEGVVTDLTRVRLLLLSLSDRPGHRGSINDIYCVSCVAHNLMSVHVTGKGTSTTNCVFEKKTCVNVTGKEVCTRNQVCFLTSKDTVRTLTVNSCVVNHAHLVATKERHNSQ